MGVLTPIEIFCFSQSLVIAIAVVWDVGSIDLWEIVPANCLHYFPISKTICSLRKVRAVQEAERTIHHVFYEKTMTSYRFKCIGATGEIVSKVIGPRYKCGIGYLGELKHDPVKLFGRNGYV